MNVNVIYSGPKICMACGCIVRNCYLDGELSRRVEVDPIHPATKKSPNPIYETHECIPDDLDGEDEED